MPGTAYKEEKTDENGNEFRSKYLSNHTHYLPTDPNARISTKPGKPRNLNYYGQIGVDTKKNDLLQQRKRLQRMSFEKRMLRRKEQVQKTIAQRILRTIPIPTPTLQTDQKRKICRADVPTPQFNS